MTIRILQGDCREVLKTLPDASVDSIVTDPPYHLTNNSGGPHNKTRAGACTGGFMGMAWDGGDVAQDPAMWAECLRVLKPGGYLLAFSGTRTYHRMAVAIEDAGFEIRDQIGWAYGSGFPKSRNVAADMDESYNAAVWQGWGTALKPAWEPICMARKPLQGTVARNVLKHGTGALNIDGCRVLVDGEERAPITGKGALPARHKVDAPREAGVVAQPHELGRWPANLIHDGSDEVLATFPREAGARALVRGTERSCASVGRVTGHRDRVPGAFHGDTGSAARFFYCAKADRTDRNDGGIDNHHPTVKPTDLMRWLCRLVTPPGGTVLDPFMGSGSTLKAAELEGFSAIGIELSAEYIEIARRRIAADAPLFAEQAA